MMTDSSAVLSLSGTSQQLSYCDWFSFEKERYTPYTVLRGRWICPTSTRIGEIFGLSFSLAGKPLHDGFAEKIDIEQKSGYTSVTVRSFGYTAALARNQYEDGLLTDINLDSIIFGKLSFPGIDRETGTPTVDYVNYYGGTTVWDAVVCYGVRANKNYPYISGRNKVMITPAGEEIAATIGSGGILAHGYETDYSRVISQISERDIDGAENAYFLRDSGIESRRITRRREINFDQEWIMSPEEGLKHKIAVSKAGINAEHITAYGFVDVDLTQKFMATDLGMSGEVDRLRVSYSHQKGLLTKLWSYRDGYCPSVQSAE